MEDGGVDINATHGGDLCGVSLCVCHEIDAVFLHIVLPLLHAKVSRGGQRGSAMAEIMQKFLVERGQDICKSLCALGGSFGKASEASVLGQLFFVELKASVFCAVEQGSRVVGGDVFLFGDFFVRKTVDIVHHEDTAVAFTEEFDGSDECFFHFHDLKHFFGGTVAEGEIFDLEEAAVFSFVESVVGLVDSDTKDPRAKASAFAVKALDVMKGAKHGFLGHFFGIAGIGEVAPYKVIHITVEFEFR